MFYFPSAQVVRVWSASDSDTNISVLINGLDANYVQQTETVVLTNGTTGVLTTKQFLRINSISLTRVPQNAGLIHAGNSDKSITLAYIGTPSNNSAGRSQMTVYTVPAGYTFYLTQSNWFQNANQPAAYRSWTQNPDGLVNIVLTFPILDNYSSTKVVPRPYPEKTDIQWQASVSQNSAIGGQIEGYLISNTYL
jgi:prophage maintenance system killer protein